MVRSCLDILILSITFSRAVIRPYRLWVAGERLVGVQGLNNGQGICGKISKRDRPVWLDVDFYLDGKVSVRIVGDRPGRLVHTPSVDSSDYELVVTVSEVVWDWL